MTEIIAIANEKGGVAKTTSTLSMAGALVEHGARVLLLDLDPQANLSLAVGIDPAKSQRHAADLLINQTDANQLVQPTSLDGLSIIPGNPGLNLSERLLPMRANYTLLLRQALAGLKNIDYVLIDCPPSIGAITLNAISAARRLIIPTQPEYFSAFALKNMLLAVQKVHQQGNPQLTFHILITLFDTRNRIHRVMREQIEAKFNGHVFGTIIQLDTQLRESQIAGMPVTHYRRKTRSAEQYRALVQELRQHVSEIAQPAA